VPKLGASCCSPEPACAGVVSVLAARGDEMGSKTRPASKTAIRLMLSQMAGRTAAILRNRPNALSKAVRALFDIDEIDRGAETAGAQLEIIRGKGPQ